MLDQTVKKYIDACVLCWLATVDDQNQPNVSPKEIFTHRSDDTLLIAHIASPNSVQNIRKQPAVCVCFVDVFVQKGFKLNGSAAIIEPGDPHFEKDLEPLLALFPYRALIKAVIKITVKQVTPILAPGYYLFEGATETSQVQLAMKRYGVRPL